VTIAGVPLDPTVEFRIIVVEDVLFDLRAASPQIVLREAEGAQRRIAIPVGLSEGQSLHLAMRGEPSKRPSSAELTVLLLQELRADLVAVRIARYEAGVFFAELDLMTPQGQRVFDCRPSDAIAIALRSSTAAPLLIDAKILDDLAA